MDRRELLKLITLATGGALIGAEFFLTGCKNDESQLGGVNFTQDDLAFLDEVGETILPKTNTPGAKETKIAEFMKIMVNDCYDPDDQKTFHEGIGQLNEASKKMYKVGFMEATPGQRHDLLVSLDKEAKEYQQKKNDFDKLQSEKEKAEKAGGKEYKKEKMQSHYFTMMKQLTIAGYFTSEAGSKQALRYVPVPGKFDGDYPYKKGDKAWAATG